MDEQTAKKIVIIGDGYVGKTCILHCIETNEFLEQTPNIYDVRVLERKIKNVAFQMKFIDTAGQEEFDLTRRLFYKDAEVFLMCFDLSNLVSFNNILEKWYPEIKSYLPKPIILVGTKSDLPHHVNQHQISELLKEIGAVDYVKCSAKSHTGIDELINSIIKFGYGKNKKSCCIQ